MYSIWILLNKDFKNTFFGLCTLMPLSKWSHLFNTLYWAFGLSIYSYWPLYSLRMTPSGLMIKLFMAVVNDLVNGNIEYRSKRCQLTLAYVQQQKLQFFWSSPAVNALGTWISIWLSSKKQNKYFHFYIITRKNAIILHYG